jgi:N-acylneuraminate cytidylyltransferase
VIAGNKVLAIIPARGGSKGVPRKNIRLLAGKPLIAWTIEEAKKSKYIDRLILSSEDDEIMQVAGDYGCEVPFKRPIELAQDDTPGVEPIIHALHTLKGRYDYVVMLQPTSPLRTAADIDECMEKCAASDAPACVSVSEVEQSPYWMYRLDKKMRMLPLINSGTLISRRQDLPPVYILNGAVYVARSEYLLTQKSFITDETVGYEMPLKKSLDIDNEYDLKLAELILQYSSPDRVL